MWIRLALASLLVLVAGCGGRSDPPRARTTQVDGRNVFLIQPPEGKCDDTSACAVAWNIDSRLYETQCSTVSERERTGELYAVGVEGEHMPFAEATILPGVEPSDRLAVKQKRPGAPCPRDVGEWVMLRQVGTIE